MKASAFFRSTAETLPAIVGAAIGGSVFAFLDLPAPWLSGAMLGAMASGVVRQIPDMPVWMRDVALLLAGTSMGAGVTPETLTLMSKVPVSFVLLASCIVLIMVTSTLWLTRIHGWRGEDAMLAAAPGALQTVLIVGAERGADVVGIMVVQSLRLFVLIAVLPGLIGWIEGAKGSAANATAIPMDFWTLLAMLAGGAACAWILAKAKMTAAMMLGGALFGAVLHGSGLVRGQVPAPLAIAGFVLIGVMVASRTRGLTGASLMRYGGASIASFVASVAVAAAFAVAASAFLDIRLGATLIAFAPGGVEAMTLLSLSLAYDPLYVAAHHIARFMGIGFLLPLWFRFTDRTPKGS